MVVDPPDAAMLLERVAAGDEEALHRLFDMFRPRLRSYLWRQLDGDLGAVDEALQDVFVAAWRTAARYRGDASVATWLFQIAHYRAVRMRKGRRGSTQDVSLDSPNEVLSAEAESTMSASYEERVLDRVVLSQALDALSPKHREALYLVSRQGFSLEEAAAILGVPVGTVKSRMSYARKALLAALAGASTKGGTA